MDKIKFIKRLFSSILIAVFLFSCSSYQIFYTSELNKYLEPNRAYNYISSFSVRIPKGFFQVNDNRFYASDIWLVKKNYSETISVNKINTEKIFDESDVLDLLIKFRKMNYQQKLKNFNKFTFSIERKKIRGFKYVNNKNRYIFVLLYKVGKNFFEIVYTKNNDTFSSIPLAVINSLKLS